MDLIYDPLKRRLAHVLVKMPVEAYTMPNGQCFPRLPQTGHRGRLRRRQAGRPLVNHDRLALGTRHHATEREVQVAEVLSTELISLCGAHEFRKQPPNMVELQNSKPESELSFSYRFLRILETPFITIDK